MPATTNTSNNPIVNESVARVSRLPRLRRLSDPSEVMSLEEISSDRTCLAEHLAWQEPPEIQEVDAILPTALREELLEAATPPAQTAINQPLSPSDRYTRSIRQWLEETLPPQLEPTISYTRGPIPTPEARKKITPIQRYGKNADRYGQALEKFRAVVRLRIEVWKATEALEALLEQEIRACDMVEIGDSGIIGCASGYADLETKELDNLDFNDMFDSIGIRGVFST